MHTTRGAVYIQTGDYDKGISDESEVLHLDPNKASAYFYRAYAYKHSGDYDKALTDYNEFIRLKPDSAEAYNELAWLLAVCPNANVRNGGEGRRVCKESL